MRELIVCIDLLAKGFDVFKNVSASGIDLACHKSNAVFLIEVKTGKVKSGRTYRTKNNLTGIGICQRQIERCDVVAAVDHENSVFYVMRRDVMDRWISVYGEGNIAQIERLELESVY